MKKNMEAMRNKFYLCSRRDGAHEEGIGRHKAIKKRAICYFVIAILFFV